MPWQMLLPYILWQMLQPCHVVDGMITEADGITSCLARWQMLPFLFYFVWQMLSHYVCMLQLIFDRCCCQSGRWNSHQGGYTKHGRCYGHTWQME